DVAAAVRATLAHPAEIAVVVAVAAVPAAIALPEPAVAPAILPTAPLAAPAVAYATTIATAMAAGPLKPEWLYLKLSCSSLTWRQSTSPRCSISLSHAN